jgi:hypothetical protein
MQQLPDIRSWRPDVSPEYAEQRVKWLREQIIDADRAIEAQQRIIASEGPLSAYLLSTESLRESQRQLESDLAEQMHQREFEIVDFALDGTPYNQHRASARSLSIFLDKMQRLFERVGQSIGSARITPTVSEHIRKSCQLEIAGFFPSSFGIRFTTRTNADLTGESVSSSALDATFDLINSQNPVDEVARLGQRVMSNYRNLVTTLVKLEASPKASWRTPSGEERSWNCSPENLYALSNRLASIHEITPKTLTTVGFLTGANLRRHRFELQSESGNITGSAPRELDTQITAGFGKLCRVTYVETTFIDESTDQEKKSRTLIDITTV